MYLDVTIVEVTATTNPKTRYTGISRKVVRKKMYTLLSRKILWDVINTLFLTLSMSNLLLLLSFTTHNYTPMASRAFLSNFFEKQLTQNRPQYPSGLSRALFPTSFLEKAVHTKPTRIFVSLCDPRTFHALCKFRHDYKPSLREARN